jgi:hypothetical protein
MYLADVNMRILEKEVTYLADVNMRLLEEGVTPPGVAPGESAPTPMGSDEVTTIVASCIAALVALALTILAVRIICGRKSTEEGE